MHEHMDITPVKDTSSILQLQTIGRLWYPSEYLHICIAFCSATSSLPQPLLITANNSAGHLLAMRDEFIKLRISHSPDVAAVLIGCRSKKAEERIDGFIN
jgi:hypothetical protein